MPSTQFFPKMQFSPNKRNPPYLKNPINKNGRESRNPSIPLGIIHFVENDFIEKVDNFIKKADHIIEKVDHFIEGLVRLG